MKFDPTLAQQFLKIKTMSTSPSSVGLVGSSSSLNLIVEFSFNHSFFLCLGSSNVLGSKPTAFKNSNLLQHLSSRFVANRICLCLYPVALVSFFRIGIWEVVNFFYMVGVGCNWYASLIIWSKVKYGIPPHDVRRCHL